MAFSKSSVPVPIKKGAYFIFCSRGKVMYTLYFWGGWGNVNNLTVPVFIEFGFIYDKFSKFYIKIFLLGS